MSAPANDQRQGGDVSPGACPSSVREEQVGGNPYTWVPRILFGEGVLQALYYPKPHKEHLVCEDLLERYINQIRPNLRRRTKNSLEWAASIFRVYLRRHGALSVASQRFKCRPLYPSGKVAFDLNYIANKHLG